MHMPTLLCVTAMILALLGPLLLLARGRDQNADALVWWSAAMMTGAVGLALAAAGAWLPRFIDTDIADALMLLATAVSWSAARVFVGRPVLPLVIAAGPLVWLALNQLPPIGDSLRAETAIPCAIGSAYTWAAAAELWRSREEDLPSRMAAYVLLLVHGTVFLIRAALATAGLDAAGARLPDFVAPALVIEALLHTTGMAFVLLAMAKERAELRSRQSLTAARDAALSASNAKSTFLARLSHEVRTPLNAVLGLAQVLAADRRLTTEQREQAVTLEQAGRHLLSLVNDLLDLAKIGAGKLELAIRPFAIRAVLNSCVSLLRATADARRISLHVDIAQDVPRRFEGDETRIRQLLLNLLSNAIKFSSAGMRVTVRVRAPAAGLRIEVIDNGPGVPPDKRNQLFQDYAQLDPLIARQFGGSGLGLAISAALVRAMQGRIGYEPGRQGQGSLFWIEVPLPEAGPEPEVVAEAESAAEATRPDRSGCILVVDDMPSNRLFMRTMLERAGYAVQLASGGAQAVDTVSKGGIDLVLMDVRMPDVNGFEATRRIRDLAGPAAHVPVVALTADAMPQQVQACLDAGMSGHVAKPVERADLMAEIGRVIGTRRVPATTAADH
jgi:signal transduction histidine kinase/CheY-like chemotaxis protein